MAENDPNQQEPSEPDTVADDGPDVEELESDPAYNPQDENLKDLKGG